MNIRHPFVHEPRLAPALALAPEALLTREIAEVAPAATMPMMLTQLLANLGPFFYQRWTTGHLLRGRFR